MGNVLTGDNSRSMLLIPRSGSHSIAASWLLQREPDNYAVWQDNLNHHPAIYLDSQIVKVAGERDGLGVIVRNPIERFRSMCARHTGKTVEDHLVVPQYGPMQTDGCSTFFRFEDQLEAAAEWLGLSLPILHLDAAGEGHKPTLTPEQEARVREIYAADIALWESLQ
jgi:hypothetical protein